MRWMAVVFLCACGTSSPDEVPDAGGWPDAATADAQVVDADPRPSLATDAEYLDQQPDSGQGVHDAQ